MGGFYSDVEVDPYYAELKEELDSATNLTHPDIFVMCDTWEEVRDKVLPKHGFWYETHNPYALEYVIWRYEGIVYKGKYRLYINYF